MAEPDLDAAVQDDEPKQDNEGEIEPESELDAEVARYVGLLRLGAPGALAATKALLQRPLGDDLDAAFAAMQELSARHFASEEGQEGMAAFAEKRPPSWVRPT